MSEKKYQVIVQGIFESPDHEQLRGLVEQAPDHELLTARFTEEGTITYELPPRTFTFRCLVPAGTEEEEQNVLSRAEELATAAVQRLGAQTRSLKSVSTDLESIKIRPRRRR